MQTKMKSGRIGILLGKGSWKMHPVPAGGREQSEELN